MKFWTKIRALFLRKRLEREMAAEMQAHLDELAERNVAAGMAPEEARYAARRAFGGVEQIKEEARDERRWGWLENFGQDVRYGWRQLAKHPGFTLVAAGSLALGIGANTAIFSLVNAVMLKSLPVPQPGELMLFQWTGRHAPHPSRGRITRDPVTKVETGNAFSALAFARFQENAGALANIFAFASLEDAKVRIDGEVEASAVAQVVSGGYFAGLRVNAALGRVLTPEDDRPGAEPVAVISDRFWRRRLAADPAAVGKTIKINDVAVTVVGVSPPDFVGALEVGEAADFSLPMSVFPQVSPVMAVMMKRPGFIWYWQVMGRPKPGVAAEQVVAALDEPFRQSTLEDIPEGVTWDPQQFSSGAERLRLQFIPGGQGLQGARANYSRSLAILSGLTGLVLLIACLNVANLLLARGARRRREIAVRLALGAGRPRLVRQLLAESLLLTALGGLAGLLVAHWGSGLILALRPIGGDAFSLNVAVDHRVFGFTLAVTLVTGALFGLAPALQATRVDLTADFTGGQTGAKSRPVGRWPLSQVLMVAQVALALVLLTGAGLFARTLFNLQREDPGYNREGLILFNVDVSAAGYASSQGVEVHRRVAERLRTIPGVTGVTFSNFAPMNGSMARTRITLADRVLAPNQDTTVLVNNIEAGFFSALGIPLLAGREVSLRDNVAAPLVAVVNQAFVERFYGRANPLGHHLTTRRAVFAKTPGVADIEIVGVVRDAKYFDVRGSVQPMMFLPYAQDSSGAFNFSQAAFAVRVAGGVGEAAAAMRRAVGELDPKLTPTDLRSHDEQMARLFRQERLFARLSVFYGGFALALVSIGLFGLMSYTVARRTNEIGIRIALGALPARVVAMVLGHSLRLVLVGVILGIGASVAAVRLVTHLLFGVTAMDPLTFGAVAVVTLGIGLAAAWIPARRAAKVDPMVALRTE